MDRADKRQQLADHYLDFYRIAYRMLRNADAACDAVQEGIVRTLVRPLVADPVRYCYKAVRHACVDTLRQQQRTRALQEADAVCDPDHSQLLAEVGTAYKALPQRVRLAVELYDIEGCTFAEVGTIMRLSKSTARRLVDEGHRQMKKTLQSLI